MARNYKDEYEKFQDSPSQLKKRAALNRANYKRGTYGNNDGLDVSHTDDGIKLEKSSINKGRKEKSRMKGSKRNYKEGGKTAKGLKISEKELKRLKKASPYKRQYTVTDGVKKDYPYGKTKDWKNFWNAKSEQEQDKIIKKIQKKQRTIKQQGGYLKGASHKQGGIPAIIAGQEPVELEGGEYIIKKSSVDKLGKDVLSEINKKGRIPTMATETEEYGLGGWLKKKKSNLGKRGKQQLTEEADKWTFGEKLTKKGREKAKRRKSRKKVVKVLDTIDPSKVTTTIKTGDKLAQTKKALGQSGKIKKKDVKGLQITKGGAYPKYGKKTKSAGSFRDAFKAARKGGKKTFEFQGRKYTSETAEEKSSRVAKAAADKKAKQSKQNIDDSIAKAKKQYAESDVAEAQMGGMMPRPHQAPMRTYKYGGQVSTHSPKAAGGDPIAVHSHSGYKAGE